MKENKLAEKQGMSVFRNLKKNMNSPTKIMTKLFTHLLSWTLTEIQSEIKLILIILQWLLLDSAFISFRVKQPVHLSMSIILSSSQTGRVSCRSHCLTGRIQEEGLNLQTWGRAPTLLTFRKNVKTSVCQKAWKSKMWYAPLEWLVSWVFSLPC